LSLINNKYFLIQSIQPKEAWRILFTIAGIFSIGLIFTVFSPLEFVFSILGKKSVNGCPLLTLTSVPCPFCGMGSIFKEALKLNFNNIFYHNPLGIIFYILFAITSGCIIYLALRKRKIVFTSPGYKLVWIPAGFIILMWILNILYGHHP